jgi:hypothetical protein
MVEAFLKEIVGVGDVEEVAREDLSGLGGKRL